MKSLRNRIIDLNLMLEIIQTDTDTLTHKERMDFFIKAQVFGVAHKVRAALINDILHYKRGTTFDLSKITKPAWGVLLDRINEMRLFVNWLSENLETRYEIRYPLIRTLSWRSDGSFYCFDRSQEITKVEVYTLPEGGLENSVGIKNIPYVPPELVKEFVFKGDEFLVLMNAFDGIPFSAVHKCEYKKCGRLFVANDSRQKFCSGRCRNTVNVYRTRVRKK